MSVSCQKQLSITVSSATAVDAYWTFEETGANDRVDKVHGIHLVPTLALDGGSGFLSNSPGIQGQAAIYFLGAPGTGSQFPQMATANFPGSTFLKMQAGKGFSFAGWFFVFGDANQTATHSWELDFIDALFNDLGSIEITLHANQIQMIAFDSLGTQDTLSTALPISSWTFCHIWFDPSDHKIHMSLNNGATQNGALALTYAPVGAGDTGQIFNFNGQYHCLQDEWAIKVSGIFNPAQQAYLYNSGIGRTWPLNLPP